MVFKQKFSGNAQTSERKLWKVSPKEIPDLEIFCQDGHHNCGLTHVISQDIGIVNTFWISGLPQTVQWPTTAFELLSRSQGESQTSSNITTAPAAVVREVLRHLSQAGSSSNTTKDSSCISSWSTSPPQQAAATLLQLQTAAVREVHRHLSRQHSSNITTAPRQQVENYIAS